MASYLFLLGSVAELSLAELTALTHKQTEKLDFWVDNLVKIELANNAEAKKLFSQLGGTIKLLKLIETFQEKQSTDLVVEVADYLTQSIPQDKINFSLTVLGQLELEVSVSQLKKHLSTIGRKARYLKAGKEGLSAAVLLHQDVKEVFLISKNNQVFLAETIEVQDIDNWTNRDRNKPYADRKKGMLPPKIARMMVNLALGNLEIGGIKAASDSANKAPLIYDPFCGSGTVLLEALMRECWVVGSDLDSDSVAGTQANINWLQANYNLVGRSSVFKADATHARLSQLPDQVDAIVTEPFLGKPKPNLKQAVNTIKGLEKLYLGAFKNWRDLLKTQGIVVIVFPVISLGNKHFSLERLIDKLAALGYTPLTKPLVYARPQAVIKRQIWILKKTD